MDAKADRTDTAGSAGRLAALRGELKKRGLAGFVVPLQDEHQAEWVPAHARRLQWLTGFAGSAGLAVVLADKAAIFVDGRYTLQVRSQTDTALFPPRHPTAPAPRSSLPRPNPSVRQAGPSAQRDHHAQPRRPRAGR